MRGWRWRRGSRREILLRPTVQLGTVVEIRLSLDQTRKINPNSTEAGDAIVTWDRVQQSEDGNYHICLMAHHLIGRRGGI